MGTYTNDNQALLYIFPLKNLYVLILNNWKYSIYLKVDSRTLAVMPKVQMNLNHTFVIRGRVKVL